MASVINAQITGLYTASNLFSSSPVGSLSQADDVVLNFSSILEPRRGFEAKGYTFGTSTDRAQALAYYGSTLVISYTGGKLAYDTGAAFSDYSGTYTAPDATIAPLRFVQAAGNLYFSTNAGTKVLTTASGTPADAGVPRALRTYVYNASSNGWQAYNTAVRYRVVWGIKDANQNEKLGDPSGSFVLRNQIKILATKLVRTVADGSHPAGKVSATVNLDSGHFLNPGDTVVLSPGEANFAAGTKTVVTTPSGWTFTYNEAGANVPSTLDQDFQKTRSATLQIDVPAGITTSHFFQVYRSDPSATADTAPSDELYLVYEGQPSSSDIAAGFVQFNDITPTDFLASASEPLYTNANQGEGLINQNERPPIAIDLAYWDERLWYANTTQRQRFTLQLLGVGSPAGIQVNDTLTIGSRVYTFKSPGSILSQEATIYSVDTPAKNIERTARDLCIVINSDPSSTVYAHYVSGENENPGKILIEERAIGGAQFVVLASRSSAFNPILTSSSVTATQVGYSDNNRRPHGLMFSKLGEPEAVPVVNEVLVGSRNLPIRRIAPLKDKLYVFKDEGIYIVTPAGNGGYRAEQFAVTRLLGANTVAALSDRLFAGITDQGSVTVSDAGVSVISRPIESTITGLYGDTLSAVKQISFAVGYESDRRFVCWTPSVSSDLYGTQAFNYSTATSSWTRWTKGATCALIDPNTDKLVIGSGTANKILVERKAFTREDYADESFTATINSISGNVLTLASATGITAGDALRQSLAVTSLVTAVSGNAVTVVSSSGFTTGSVTVLPGIPAAIQWNPIAAGDPGFLKQFTEVTFLFKKSGVYSSTISFENENGEAPSTVTVSAPGYGASQWGAFPWGSPSQKLFRIAPQSADKQYAAQLTLGFSNREALTSWKLQGFVAQARPVSERNGR